MRNRVSLNLQQTQDGLPLWQPWTELDARGQAKVSCAWLLQMPQQPLSALSRATLVGPEHLEAPELLMRTAALLVAAFA